MAKLNLEKLKIKNIGIDKIRIHPVKRGDIKKLRTRVIAGAVAVAASASLLVSASFDDPADIIHASNDVHPVTIVQMVGDAVPDDSGDDEDQQEEQEEKRRGGVIRKLRQLLLRMPVAVRAIIVVPLWAVGTGMTMLWTAICNLGILPPMIASLARIVLTAAVILAVGAAAVRVMFPDIPIKKIFTVKNLLISACTACLAETVMAAVELFAPNGERIAQFAHSVIMLLVLFAAVMMMCVKENRKKQN